MKKATARGPRIGRAAQASGPRRERAKKARIALLGALGLASAAAVPLFAVACAPAESQNPTDPLQAIESLDQKQKQYAARNAGENLLADAKQKAEAEGNVLVYSINWFAVFHKFGSVSHLLKVLEINPKKEILVLNRDNAYLTAGLLAPVLGDKAKYPNVAHKEIKAEASIEQGWARYDFSQIKPEIQALAEAGKKIDLYLDDYTLFKPLDNYIGAYGSYLKNETSFAPVAAANEAIYRNYAYLAKTRSINLIFDGRASWEFYSRKFMDFMVASGIGMHQGTKTYPQLALLRETLGESDGTGSEKSAQFAGENLGGMILLALISGNQAPGKAPVRQAKYFVAGTNTILDFNDFGATKNDLPTLLGDKPPAGKFFDPYRSIDGDIIGLYRSFAADTKRLFLSVFSISSVSREILRNKTNVVYSGSLWSSAGVFDSEAKTIIALYRANESQAIRPLQIVYKNHPRESGGYQERMWLRLDGLKSQDPGLVRFEPRRDVVFLDKDVPMEYYVLEGFADSDASLNNSVLYYSGYSTLVYFLNAARLDGSIAKVIASRATVEGSVNRYNGYPSRVFPAGRLISPEQI